MLQLQKKNIPHIEGCLVNEKRIQELEDIILGRDSAETAVYMSKANLVATVNANEQFALWKHDIDKQFKKITDLISNVDKSVKLIDHNLTKLYDAQ